MSFREAEIYYPPYSWPSKKEKKKAHLQRSCLQLSQGKRQLTWSHLHKCEFSLKPRSKGKAMIMEMTAEAQEPMLWHSCFYFFPWWLWKNLFHQSCHSCQYLGFWLSNLHIKKHPGLWKYHRKLPPCNLQPTSYRLQVEYGCNQKAHLHPSTSQDSASVWVCL